MDELNSVQLREAKPPFPFSYTHMPSKACETFLYPAVLHILRLVRLSQGNTITMVGFELTTQKAMVC